MEDNKVSQETQQPTELTAGEMLRNARTTGRRKREIPTIAKQLCIREEFLQALEDGNYTFIPELVYILGFARNYAMELGLNPDEIVTKIKREMGVVSDCSSADNDADTACALGGKSGRGDKVKFDFRVIVMYAWEFVVRHWYWFVGGLVALILAITVAIFLFVGRTDTGGASADTVVAEETIADPAFKMAVRERWGAENRKDTNIVLQARRGSWIKIEDARGRTEFSRVLVEGDVYYVPTKSKYKATFGDAGGIDVWVEGKLAPKVGEDHVRKSDILLDAEKLMAGPKSDKADKSDKKSNKSSKEEKTTEDSAPENNATNGADEEE